MKYIPGDARRKVIEWGKHDPADPEELRYLLLRVAYLYADERGEIYHPPRLISQSDRREQGGNNG